MTTLAPPRRKVYRQPVALPRWHPSGHQPSREQAEFVLDARHPLVAMIGGYGSGKTHAMAHKALWLAKASPRCDGGVVGPSYKALKKDVVPALTMLLDDAELRYTFNRSDLFIHVHAWRSTLWLATADDPDTIKGPNWAWAVGNEPGIWPHDAFLNMLARVRDARSNCLQVALAGTPEGFNWLYEETVKRHPRSPLGEDPRCRVIFSSTRNAVWLPESYLERLESTYSDDLLAEKIDGMFTVVGEGRAYPKFDRTKHVISLTPRPSSPVILAMDFNIEPACALVIQRVNDPSRGPITHVIDEITLGRATTRDVVAAFVEKWGDRAKTWGLEFVADASGAAETAATGHSCLGVAEDVLNRAGLTWAHRTPQANPHVQTRLDAVNSQLYHGRVYIDPRCEDLIADLDQVMLRPGTREIDKRKDPKRTHWSDALGYDLSDFYVRPLATDAGFYPMATR